MRLLQLLQSPGYFGARNFTSLKVPFCVDPPIEKKIRATMFRVEGDAPLAIVKGCTLKIGNRSER